MFRIKNLFSMFLLKKNISKKIYTSGIVVISAYFVVTVLIMGTNGFSASGENINKYNIYGIEDESKDGITEDETVIDSEESSISKIFKKIIDSEINQKEETPILSKEIEAEAEARERFRTSPNNETEEEISLLSKKDYDALVRIVEAEATGEDVTGKIMVANVVLNRVENPRFPNTIYGVIHQRINGKAQFSPLDDGRYNRVTIKNTTYEAVERALKGEDYSNGALFFMSRNLAADSATTWFDVNLRKVAHHGTHEFFAYK